MVEIVKRDMIRSGTCKQMINPEIIISITDRPPVIKLIPVSTYRDLPKNDREKDEAIRENILYEQPTIECEIVMKPQVFISLTKHLLDVGNWLEKQMPEDYKQWADTVAEALAKHKK